MESTVEHTNTQQSLGYLCHLMTSSHAHKVCSIQLHSNGLPPLMSSTLTLCIKSLKHADMGFVVDRLLNKPLPPVHRRSPTGNASRPFNQTRSPLCVYVNFVISGGVRYVNTYGSYTTQNISRFINIVVHHDIIHIKVIFIVISSIYTMGSTCVGIF
jgi:hypothetical protein